MSILVNKDTRLVVQGITGREGAFHTEQMIAYGTNVVAGVTPGKGGGWAVGNVPIFDTVRRGGRRNRRQHQHHLRARQGRAGCDPRGRRRGHSADHLHHRRHPGAGHAQGPRLSGRRQVAPDRPQLSWLDHPGRGQGRHHARPHPLTRATSALVSRSGTLTYEVVYALTLRGIGQSTAVGIGGDPINGTSFVDVLRLFEDDPETRQVVMIGEIGGTDEEKAAEFIAAEMTKPVTAFIAGQTAPPGKRMGHAGAIISGGKGTAADKIHALEAAGVRIARHPGEIAELVAALM